MAPRLKLRLRDATGEVDVLLFGEEALLFFFGTRSIVEAPVSPGQSQPAADRIVGRDLTPALDGLLGTTHQYVGGVLKKEGMRKRERCFVIEFKRIEHHGGLLGLMRHPDKDDAEMMDEIVFAGTLWSR